MKSQWAPREAGPLNQEQMGLFEDHGPRGARWDPGSRANCPLKQAGALQTPGAGGGSEINSKIACSRTMGALELDAAPAEEPMRPLEQVGT